ncbi:hypothetical protein Tco_0335846 [Tanacetum coccineum]
MEMICSWMRMKKRFHRAKNDFIEIKVYDWEFKGLFVVLLVDNVEEQRRNFNSAETIRREKKCLEVRGNIRSKKAIRDETTIRSETTIRREETIRSEEQDVREFVSGDCKDCV